jgi:heme/copper-type cytochrome/quinol oxidase subunit 4
VNIVISGVLFPIIAILPFELQYHLLRLDTTWTTYWVGFICTNFILAASQWFVIKPTGTSREKISFLLAFDLIQPVAASLLLFSSSELNLFDPYFTMSLSFVGFSTMFAVVASLLIANEPNEKFEFEWYGSGSVPLLATTRKDAGDSSQSLLTLQGHPIVPLDSKEQSADSMFEYDDTQKSENEAAITEKKIHPEETAAKLEVGVLCRFFAKLKVVLSRFFCVVLSRFFCVVLPRFFCGQDDAERPPVYKFGTYFFEVALFKHIVCFKLADF